MKRSGNAADAAYLRSARERLRLSQPELGERLGLSQSAVSHVENGWTPLAPPTRRDVERLLARSEAEAVLVDSGGWQRGVAPCEAYDRLLQVPAPDVLMEHVETCATCTARAVLLLAAMTRKAVAGLRR